MLSCYVMYVPINMFFYISPDSTNDIQCTFYIFIPFKKGAQSPIKSLKMGTFKRNLYFHITKVFLWSITVVWAKNGKNRAINNV